MEVYKTEAKEIVRRFVSRQITHKECVAALDAALAGVFPRLTVANLESVQFDVEANNRKVAAELRRRQPTPHTVISPQLN